MIIKGLYTSGFGSNCYIVLDNTFENAVVVDPSVSYADAIAQIGFTPSFCAILLTHAHADHFLELESWTKGTGAPVMIGASDAYTLTNPEANCASFLGLGDFRYVGSVSNLSNGDKIMIGDESLTVISSPGHSVGSVCYYAPGILLSGDTIFAEGGIGRTDLYGGDEEVLRSSIATLIDLPPKTVVYPGHGPKTTVKELTFFHRYFL